VSAVAAGLRAAADLVELMAASDLPRPTVSSYSSGYDAVDVQWFLQRKDSHEAQKAAAAGIMRAVRGDWVKSAGEWDGPVAEFEQERDGLKLSISVERDAVCERVVVGTETVTHPAKPAEPERTETVDKVEWRCEPVLSEATA